MNRVPLTILLLHVGFLSFGQVITGTVLDQETGEPVSFASLFFDGTFVGTTADENGRFELDVSKYRSRPLHISAMGYDPGVITGFTRAEPFLVLLTPRVFEIEEVSVSTESLARKRKACLNIFRSEFLGRTGNARRCSILNERDITFNYGSDQDTLRAYASQPIRIENLALGYEETYYLDKFEYDRKSGNLFFTGNIIFTRDLNQGDSYDKSFARRRKYAYEGSRMHFFRTLWNNDLVLSPFSVKDSSGVELYYDQLVVKDQGGGSYLTYHRGLDIYYYSIHSYIIFLGEKAWFEEDGFFDPAALRWGGRMSLKRIADWLPYEYLLPQE